MKKENDKKGLIVLVIVLSILVVGLASYLIYDKVLVDDENISSVDKEQNWNNEVENNIKNYEVRETDLNKVLDIIGVSFDETGYNYDWLNFSISKNNYKENAELIFSLYAMINDIGTHRGDEEKCQNSSECQRVYGPADSRTILKSDANRIKELYNFDSELDDWLLDMPEYDQDYLYMSNGSVVLGPMQFSINHDVIAEYAVINSQDEIKIIDNQVVTEYEFNNENAQNTVKSTKEQEVTYLFKKNSNDRFYLYSVDVK